MKTKARDAAESRPQENPPPSGGRSGGGHDAGGVLDRTVPPGSASIRPFVFPQVHRALLDNGLTVVSARHGHLPLVTARLVIDAGAAREAARSAGLARLAASALDTGTADRDAATLAWDLERLGLELDTDASWDAIGVEVTTPATRLEPALALLAEIARTAGFPEPEVERLRDAQLAELLQRSKEPRALASDAAVQLIFGPDALYGRPVVGTTATVRTLTRDDTVAFHREHVTPATTSLLLIGDIDDAHAAELARRYFGDWRTTESPVAGPGSTAAAPRRETTVFAVDRPDAVQSEIRVGHVAVARDHPDYFPLLVTNTLLGGAFTSRLNLSLRERHGFTYGVRSGFVFRRLPGPFIIETAVGTDVTARAVEEIMRELKLIRTDGATEDEVDSARRYLSGVMPLQLQTTEQLAARLADLVVYDLPDDYFQTYAARIEAVTRDDVNRVAREHLHIDGLTIVVAGNTDAVSDGLRALEIGPVVPHAAAAE